ncbi:MAG: ABC transporter substrate-binding protein [Rhodospirillaceae bacterium]|nr:ABC transporter substrate-binding protein [Rhodospirillaceae bacterium]
MELSGIIEPVSRSAAISSGQVDIVLVADPTMLLTLKDDPNVEIVQAPGSEFFVMTMWIDSPPFDDVRVR